MPVVVTGASGRVGRAAVRAFIRTSPEVRAFVRRRDSADGLRSLGAKVAVGEVGDVDTLAVVMRGAHTVCHLVGGLHLPDEDTYRRANLESVETALLAAERAKVARFLTLSYPGAAATSSNAYLRFKGLAEDAVIASGIEHVIVRCTLVFPPVRVIVRRGWPTIVLGTGRQRVAPVFVEDVAAVLAAADDRAHAPVGTWGLEGPDRVTVDDLADLVAGRRPKVHVAGRTAQRLTRMSGTAVEILEADSLADGADAAREFGVVRTSVADGLERAGKRHLER